MKKFLSLVLTLFVSSFVFAAPPKENKKSMPPTSPNNYQLQMKQDFDKISKDYTIVKVDKICQKEYPKDVGLNCLVIGNLLISKNEATAKEILDFAHENDYKIIRRYYRI
mgnify:CR=1 FL=1